MDDAKTVEVKPKQEPKKSSLRSRDKSRKGKKGGTSKKNPVRREQRKRKVKSQWKNFLEDAKWNLIYFFRQYYLYICVALFVAFLLLALYFAEDVLDIHKLPKITSTVKFTFDMGGKELGTIAIGLFGNVCPQTVTNFLMLSEHEKGYGYKGSRIHQVIRNHIIVGGDIVNGDGTGGRSALDRPFEFESFRVRHVGPGYIGMVVLENNKNSSRSSQFYITTNAVPQLDGRGVLFGKVMQGIEVLTKIDKTELNDEMQPATNITISHIDVQKKTKI